jgi:3-dehydro-L-gulonate 2-dehydrogenase
MRVGYQELYDALLKALMTTPIDAERARLCARLIAETTRDGVYSHGLNLFPRLMKMIRSGVVDVTARPLRLSGCGGLERWDGCRGIGNLNAYACMEAAIGLSRTHGIGCVALANTNHWMRGGTYGWQAAEARVIGLCWTNTLPNLPPWGATVPRIGNNPLVIAVPAAKGSDAHVVLDMAMSQFSYGALASYRRRGELLPVPGGFDASGELTRDPAAIEASRRPLPVGFWKGSGLSIILDMMAAVLANGLATHEIPANPEQETGLSQVFIAIDPGAHGAPASRGPHDAECVGAILAQLDARYPGERTLATRRRNLADGIPVEPSDWEWLQSI